MEGMNCLDQDARWPAFEGPDAGDLSDSSLIRTSLDYAFHTVSPSAQIATEYKLEFYNRLAQDCIPTPVSLDGELDVPFPDLASAPWPVSYAQDFESRSISCKSDAQEDARGMRKEVRHGLPSQSVDKRAC
jgi:hypothetical protein